MQRLHNLATRLGVRIEYTHLAMLDRDGDYNHRTRTIRLQHGMLYRLERSVLAHELGHAIHGDERSILDHLNVRQERRADEWAAHFLIDPDEYRLAEERFGTNTEHIAQELAVMDYIVTAYERTIERVGDVIYINPKHGVGQWAERYEVSA